MVHATALVASLKNTAFLRPDGTPFWQFLDSSGISYSKKDFPFLTHYRTPKVLPLFNFADYLNLTSRGEALSYLYKGLGKALNYVGPVLDQELEHGFNDHTDRHTLWVSQTGVELLQRSGNAYHGNGHYGELTEVLMTLVGMTHDLGNLQTRKEHSTYSTWLLAKLFSNTKQFPEIFRTVAHAILFHEEPVLISHNIDLTKGSPLQWALIAADKMHVGRDRVGSRSFANGIAKGALEDDIHILLNALIVRSSWHLGVGEFTWNLDFSVDQLEEKFASFTKGNKRIWMPRFFQKRFLNKGTIYRDSFISHFNEVYADRIKLAAQCVFLLFPYLSHFTVVLTDNDTRAKVGSGQMIVKKIGREAFEKRSAYGVAKDQIKKRRLPF
jgi:hypothetical protein